MAKYLKPSVATLILLVSAVLCFQIISKSISNQHAKNEFAELNHIKYGLFSVNSWKEKLQVIVRDEIKNFNFSRANEKEVKAQIQAQLGALIDKVYARIRESNEGSFKGEIKQSIIETFVDVDEIKKGIPEYADTIMKELTKAQTEKKIKGMLRKGVDQYFDRTYETQDRAQINEIILKMGVTDVESARIKLSEEITERGRVIYRNTWILIALAIILFAIFGYKKQRISVFELTFMLQILFFLLLAGVTTPMIDMEAKIAELSFVLLDHPIKFVEQILYFQSKSIMDVFGIMIIHKDLEMKIVGILMVAFSIIFPLLKMLFSTFYYFNYRNSRNKKWTQFFVFKSGKWSMTDVLIVAIFMAYIGFNGIITSQLSKLALQSEEVMVLTTNGTSLQPGFYLFMTYAILALFLTGFLTKHES